jgi:hypothetical protein
MSIELIEPVVVDDVVDVAKAAHANREGGLSPATEVDIRRRGPYFRFRIGGSELGRLKFHPENQLTQHPISEFFDSWLAAQTEQELARHEELVGVLIAGRAFDHTPIYRRDRFVIDGAHRSLAAFDASDRRNRPVKIEILAEQFDARDHGC